MKLSFVELAGFRGFRDTARIEFSRSFSVISGRNGVGKSTICDAIEFAIVGTISKYRIEKSAQESIADYLWWRGSGVAKDNYVKVGFTDEKENIFQITRRRGVEVDRSQEEIENALVNVGNHPEDALKQLSRTSIIRDELITALSLDLSESDRYHLVRSSLGGSEGFEYSERAGSVLSRAQIELKSAQDAGTILQSRTGDLLLQIAQAKEEAEQAGDLVAAIKVISESVPGLSDVPNEIAESARNEMAAKTLKSKQLGVLLLRYQELEPEIHLTNSEEFVMAYSNSRDKMANLEKEIESTTAAIKKCEEESERESEQDSFDRSLATLVEHGRHLGLQDGRCPLCNIGQTDADYRAAIEVAAARLDERARRRASLDNELDNLRLIYQTLTQKMVDAKGELLEFHDKKRIVENETNEILEGLKSDGFTSVEHMRNGDVERFISRIDSEIIDLERALYVLEASHATERINDLEEKLRKLRTERATTDREVLRWERVVDSARIIDQAVKRVSSEIVDERLSAISPLLKELYKRLRPHSEWRDIDYRIRGDVKRFLSLQVGEKLNPQFLFSSGQRRALGIAFLLSIHLSRPWCKWQTLILDDPVQHIDDYRALNLVEVLTALGNTGSQIVCGVESPALADLMVRRFGGAFEEPGTKIDLSLDNRTGAIVVDQGLLPNHGGVNFLQLAGAAE